MIILRQYQESFISDLRDSLVAHRHVLGILPTGAGKTAIASFMAKAAKEKGKRIMFTCHRDFLLDQTAEAFDEIDLSYTFIAPGHGYNPNSQVQIASIDTLKRRLHIVAPPDILIVDEAVHAAAAGWARVIEHYQSHGCYSIGLTACSERLGGQGLNPWFKGIVIGPSTGDLIEQGYLSKYRAFDHTTVDLSGVHSRAGDYIQAEINHRMDKPSITGDIVKEYRKIADGKQGLTFCCSIEHSQHVAEAFRADGYVACHIGADTDGKTRSSMLRDYRMGNIKMLTSVDIFNEGFNVPSASYAALARPTRSLSIFLQQCGRVLRAEAGKDFAYICDHANNIRHKNGQPHHGLPCDDRQWTLDDRVVKKRNGEPVIPVKSCPTCYFCHRPKPACPACGYVYPIQFREVDQVEGELIEIDKSAVEAEKKQKRQEQGRARTIEDLQRIAKERGYKSGWVWKQAQLKGIRV